MADRRVSRRFLRAVAVCVGSALASCDGQDDQGFETRWRAASDRESAERFIPPQRGLEWHRNRGILQDKPFEEVWEAVKSLPRGSSKSEVVAALGAPAQFSESAWAYMTVDPALDEIRLGLPGSAAARPASGYPATSWVPRGRPARAWGALDEIRLGPPRSE